MMRLEEIDDIEREQLSQVDEIYHEVMSKLRDKELDFEIKERVKSKQIATLRQEVTDLAKELDYAVRNVELQKEV